MPHANPSPRQAQKARQQWEIGLTHARAQRWDAALQAHRAATRLAPRDPVYALNHARALLGRGDLEGAAAEAERALRLDPDCAAARDLALDCLTRLQRHLQAAALLQSLGDPARRDPTFHLLLAASLQRAGRAREAIATLFDGLSLQPGHALLHYNLGSCFFDLDMKQEAAQCFGTGLLLGLGIWELSAQELARYAEREICLWQDHEPHMQALHAAVQALPARATQPAAAFAHLAFSADRGEQLAVGACAARHAAAGVQPLPARRSDWQPGLRRLRIGYVSGDFHAHATAFLMAEMLERHDRARFDVRLYSLGPSDGSAMRRRLEGACDGFVDAQAMSDAQVAQRVHDDGIDLLVDLKGHTSKSRFAIFPHRAAPLQLSFLGYPGTTGAECIDYVVGDPVVTPLAHAADYREKIAQLPHCYQPNDRQRRRPGPARRDAHGLPEQALVLCCFNQPYKISPEVFDLWCRVLQRQPGAVLWVLQWNDRALPNLRREAAARGIDPTRVIGAPRLPLEAHIDRLALADLFIDTWPYNAHTTASDALWAGVPVVTQRGETFASRVGASLLHATGLPELVCDSVTDYETLVNALAADPARRTALRSHLQATRDTAALFDSARYTRDFEDLLLRMATRHAQGLAPEHLPAAA